MSTICADITLGTTAAAVWTYELETDVDDIDSIRCVEVVSVELHKIGAVLQIGDARTPSWLNYAVLIRLRYKDENGDYMIAPIDPDLVDKIIFELQLTITVDTSIAFANGGEIYTLEICVMEEDCLGTEECCYPILKERTPCPGDAMTGVGWTLRFDGYNDLTADGWTLELNTENPE